MSLNWSTEKCKGGNAAEDERSARDALVFATLSVGLDKITDKNIDEWMFRLLYLQRVGLEAFNAPDGFGPAQMRALLTRWVGLSTNANVYTRAKFMSAVAKELQRMIAYDIADSKEEVLA